MQASFPGTLGGMRNSGASWSGSWKRTALSIQVILLVSIAAVPLFILRDQSQLVATRYFVPTSEPSASVAQISSGPGRQPFSWHRCTSNLASKWDRVLVPKSRACHFRNVCISKSSGNIQYYVERGAKGGGLEQSLAREFSASLVEDYWMEWKHITSWPDTKGIIVGVDVKYDAMPEGAVYVSQSTVLYGDPHFPDNFGHDIGDLMLPMYRLLRLYNLLTRDVLVVFQNRECRDYEPAFGGACELHEKLGAWLTDHPFVKLNNSGVEGIDLVCAENVVLGMAHFMMSYGPDIDGMFDRLVEHVMARYGVGPRDHPKEQQIVIFQKNGKRRLLDPAGIAKRLTESFDVSVIVVDIASLKLGRQIKLMSSTTIVISPCGGVSFSAAFLPYNGAAIFMGYWDPDKDQTVQMEDYIFDRFTRFHSLYYPTTSAESDLSESPEATDFEKYREYANVKPEYAKLESLVFSALLRVEIGYGWTASFRRPFNLKL